MQARRQQQWASAGVTPGARRFGELLARLATSGLRVESARLLTDATGPFYTVVLELTVPNLAAFEGEAPRLMGDRDWQANYQKIAPLVESGSREVFTLLE